MSYEIEFTEIAERDKERHCKTGDLKILAKIDNLLNELREPPETGTGKPKKLKHYETDLVAQNF